LDTDGVLIELLNWILDNVQTEFQYSDFMMHNTHFVKSKSKSQNTYIRH